MTICTIDVRVDCPICRNKDLRSSFQLEAKGTSINWDYCNGCGLTFQNPRLDAGTIKDIYASNEYWGNAPSSTQGTYVKYEESEGVRLRQSRRRLKIIRRATGLRAGRMLDVGCATGFFGHVAQQCGFEVTGIEPSPQMADFGRRHYGLDIRQDVLENVDVETDRYDLVTLWGTDSHFLDPREGFAKLAGSLKSGGFLAMNYQDFGHCIRILFPGIKKGAHAVFMLSKRTLHILFDSLDLEIVYHKLEWQWTTVSHICRIARMPYPKFVGPLVLLAPAISFPMVIARKR